MCFRAEIFIYFIERDPTLLFESFKHYFFNSFLFGMKNLKIKSAKMYLVETNIKVWHWRNKNIIEFYAIFLFFLHTTFAKLS